ncbi:hypothetical protein [Alienimonas chondri]|uniref:Secreted protein n=1 Tax=Alienimonas chondri TaxID=2681879 RepID=A0ABX1VHF5_9PLAN|nr:hypothetical protein [Alienimonas chondri]NNJ26901.1 hypothetical protein [Alienimonas chondri]
MFRLLSAALLAGSLLVCGSVVRGTAMCDWDAAVETRACAHCGGTVVFDPSTNRSSHCGPCETRPVALAVR